jgi:hypothetical protein
LRASAGAAPKTQSTKRATVSVARFADCEASFQIFKIRKEFPSTVAFGDLKKRFPVGRADRVNFIRFCG